MQRVPALRRFSNGTLICYVRPSVPCYHSEISRTLIATLLHPAPAHPQTCSLPRCSTRTTIIIQILPLPTGNVYCIRRWLRKFWQNSNTLPTPSMKSLNCDSPIASGFRLHSNTFERYFENRQRKTQYIAKQKRRQKRADNDNFENCETIINAVSSQIWWRNFIEP